ncbi:DegT/DnrJ/EryC1/StrS family aminotransferase [Candidatus Marinimicrobia bacterium]|nr:DegT/DnrJ/EryC1/StrS family aminotransferase [Candidatus Neomarinimicrobiota bacterium]
MKFIDLDAQQKKIRTKIERRILKVLDHGNYIMGPEVYELEEKLAHYVGVKYCVTCASGTDALLIPLMAKGVGPGDAVITTPFTYIATAEVIALLGAEPVFVDIYPSTFNLNPYEIEKAINKAKLKGLKPKAIIPVDLFGLPARYRVIDEIANKENLFVIEDTAQGLGGSIRSKKSGSLGDVASTSFFPAKPLGCYGDGGAIFTDDENLANKMRSIRVHGSGLDKYENMRIGINGRLDTIQAAILLEKLSIFDNELILRNKVADYYTKKINLNFQKPYVPKKYFSSWAQYSLLAKNEEHKNKILLSLKNSDIPAMIYYKIPLHLQKCFDHLGYKAGDFPVSEDCSRRIFSLPMYPYLTTQTQNIVIKVLNRE